MGRDELFEHRVFERVAAGGSFSSAARSLGVTVSTVTRVVQQQEAALGARLFVRQARGVEPTEAGRIWVDHVAQVLAGDARARATIESAAAGHRGTLRVSVPVFLAERVLPEAIAALVRRHPEVELDVHVSDDRVDLAAGGFDLAIRAGPLEDSSLRARRIADYRVVLAAAPSLTARLGHPRHPSELASWPVLVYGRGPSHATLRFRRGSERSEVSVRPLLRTNNVDLLVELVVRGVGVAMLPKLALRAPAATLLDTYTERARGTLYAVHPNDPGKARLRNAFLAALPLSKRD